MVNTKYELDNLLNSFNLDGFELNEGDTVVDCGANTGMFYIALREYITNFKYYGFEPDKNVFRCLEENISTFESNILINIALSNENSQKKLYIDSDHGDSSLEKFASEVTSEVRVSTLDSYNFKKIKLLKMDAEGHEYEVLEGSKKTLKNIEFICVDMGNEKGFENENTVASVTNYLLKNKFELLRFNEERTVGLFKNINTN